MIKHEQRPLLYEQNDIFLVNAVKTVWCCSNQMRYLTVHVECCHCTEPTAYTRNTAFVHFFDVIF